MMITKKLKTALTTVIVLCISFMGISQSTCELLAQKQIKKLTKELKELKEFAAENPDSYQLPASIAALGKDIDKVEPKITACKNNTGISLTSLEDNYSALKTDYNLLAKGDDQAQNKQPNYLQKNMLITQMWTYVMKFYDGPMKEKYKGLERSDIIYLLTYEDDNSVYYSNNIERGLDQLTELQEKLDDPNWLKSALAIVDNHADHPDKSQAKKDINNIYQDLSYIAAVAMPDNANLKNVLHKVEEYKNGL